MVVLGTENGQDVILSPDARRQGTYIVGTTGTGKTTLLKSIIFQDMVAGEGLCVLDPHGDMIDELLALVPPEREQDVVLFAPGDNDQIACPLGLNILDCDRSDDRQRQRVTSTVVDTLRKLFWYSWGPRMEDLLRVSILTLLDPKNKDTTLLDLWLLLSSPKHRAYYTQDLNDRYLRQFWEVQFANYNKREVVEVVGSSLNKIGRFLADPRMRNIVGQPHSAFNLRQIMDEKKILLVNLSKGDLGEDNSSLLGSVLVNLILIAALTRRDILPQERLPFHLIVDEYQSFATESFPTLQSEARKYGIDVIVAHQYRDQLDDLNRGSTLNVANFVVLRVSGIDSLELATQFDNTPEEPEIEYQPLRRTSKIDSKLFDRMSVDVAVKGKPRTYNDVAAERANTLAGLDNFVGLCRIVEKGKLKEHLFSIEPVREAGSVERAQALRQNSLVECHPAEEVAQFIEDRIGAELTFDFLQSRPGDDD